MDMKGVCMEISLLDEENMDGIEMAPVFFRTIKQARKELNRGFKNVRYEDGKYEIYEREVYSADMLSPEARDENDYTPVMIYFKSTRLTI